MKELPKRKPNRLAGFAYDGGWTYFITINTKLSEPFFGYIKNGQMILNRSGLIAHQCLGEISNHFPQAKMAEYIVMPDHIHALIILERKNDKRAGLGEDEFLGHAEDARAGHAKYVRAGHARPVLDRRQMILSKIIRGFKSASSNFIRKNDNIYFAWHRSFHDHIIRDQKEFDNIKNTSKTIRKIGKKERVLNPFSDDFVYDLHWHLIFEFINHLSFGIFFLIRNINLRISPGTWRININMKPFGITKTITHGG